MKNTIQFLFLGLLLSLVACTSSKPVTYPSNEIVPKDKALLWKITANGTKKTSYVLGTIHLIPKDEFSITPEIQTAINDTERIAFEIDMKDMLNITAQFKLLTKAFMKNGTTLRDLLSPEDYAFVRREMDDKGLPASMLERLKPMFLSTMFGTDSGSSDIIGGGGEEDDMTSVEMELYNNSKSLGKGSAGLETADYQIGLFDSIPYKVQAEMLLESLRSTDKGQDSFAELVKMYKSKDINAMHDYMAADESGGLEGFEDILLYNRNRHWIPVMRDMVRNKPTLFAVGAGHLGGDQGVIALLRRAGFRVEPVF